MTEAPANFVSLEGNKIAVSFKPDRELITAIRIVSQQYGASFTAGEIWRCLLPLTARDDVARLFFSLQWSDQFRNLTKGSLAKFQPAASVAANRFLATLGELTQPLPDGRTLYEHQRSGVEWLLNTPRAILADEMGCIDGDAIIHANRAGKGFKIKLRDLFFKFNGGKTRGKFWKKCFPTTCRSLCGEEFRQHKIEAVILMGRKPVMKLETEEGKVLRLTPDHEVLTPSGWVKTESLKPGDEILTNGRHYNVGKANANWKRGFWIDKDGYVRLSGHANHPRYSSGGVYEHILVVEKRLGRFLRLDEQVHHKNEIKHDNRDENLEVLTAKQHLAVHNGHRHLNGGISAKGGEVWLLPDVQRVTCVEMDGEADVYDIRMSDPHRNFVANGIVVHNCGKTTQAMLAARAIYETTKAHTVVITKASLISDWREEAAKLNHRVVSCYSWAKIPQPTPGQHYVLIVDEAHLGSITSIRGKAFLEWAKVSDFVFMLTGTPMVNGRHLNLFPLLKALNHPLANNLREYEKVYCGAKRVVLSRDFQIDDEKFRIRWVCKSCRHPNDQKWHYTWKFYTCGCGHKVEAPKTFIDKKGAKNAPELKRQIAPFILRRLKSECLDLPPKTRVIRQIEVTAEMETVYAQALARAKAQYMERVKSGLIAKQGEALAILSIVINAASLAKVPAAIELAEEALEEGSQPILFFERVESVKRVAEHFKITPYIGETRTEQKVEIVKAFQAGTQKVFTGTREAGGTGLTLTAGSVVIMGDRPMRPGDAEQAEDRAYRIGTIWPVTVYWLRAFPVCEKIDGFIATKQQAINALLGEGDSSESENVSAQQVLKALFEEK